MNNCCLEQQTYYNILGIPSNSNQSTIKKSYKQLAMQYHPDKTHLDREQAMERFRMLNQAYEVLSDEQKKQIYDCWEKNRQAAKKINVLNPNLCKVIQKLIKDDTVQEDEPIECKPEQQKQQQQYQEQNQYNNNNQRNNNNSNQNYYQRKYGFKQFEYVNLFNSAEETENSNFEDKINDMYDKMQQYTNNNSQSNQSNSGSSFSDLFSQNEKQQPHRQQKEKRMSLYESYLQRRDQQKSSFNFLSHCDSESSENTNSDILDFNLNSMNNDFNLDNISFQSNNSTNNSNRNNSSISYSREQIMQQKQQQQQQNNNNKSSYNQQQKQQIQDYFSCQEKSNFYSQMTNSNSQQQALKQKQCFLSKKQIQRQQQDFRMKQILDLIQKKDKIFNVIRKRITKNKGF